MYLSEIFIENFRGFGNEKDGKNLCLALSPGLNVLVGENDFPFSVVKQLNEATGQDDLTSAPGKGEGEWLGMVSDLD